MVVEGEWLATFKEAVTHSALWQLGSSGWMSSHVCVAKQTSEEEPRLLKFIALPLSVSSWSPVISDIQNLNIQQRSLISQRLNNLDSRIENSERDSPPTAFFLPYVQK